MPTPDSDASPTHGRRTRRPPRPLPLPAVQLITGPWRDLEDLRRRVEAALAGGIRWLQLRSKERSARDLLDAALVLGPILREAGALFVVNDRVDIARIAGADGVHLPEHGMSPREARRLLGEDAWLARSLHSADALGVSDRRDLDAVQFGPVYDTASKRRFGAPQGVEALSRFVEETAGDTMPVIAVGGITTEGAAACRRAGAAAVSVIGAIWEADDVEAAARRFAKA